MEDAALNVLILLAMGWSAPLSATSAGALSVNLTCALLLPRVRHHGGSLGLAAFLSAHNDVLANAAIILAGLLTSATHIRRGLIVGFGIAAANAELRV